MMRLEAKLLEETAHEIADGKPEPALEVRNKDDVLTGLSYRRKLGTGKPTYHSCWDTPSPDQPIDLDLGDVGALPGGSGGSLHHPLLGELDGGVIFGRHLGGATGRRPPVARGDTAACCKVFTNGEKCITMVEKEKRK